MPSQEAIIKAVNRCLSKQRGVDYRLNTKGVCAGLSALYIKYYLEGNARYFFDMLDKLAKLPESYKLGDDQYIDKFIINIEELQNQYKYNHTDVLQAGVDKVFLIDKLPIRNEFNLGLITSEAEWVRILHEAANEGRAYCIRGNGHAIALSYDQGKYTIYDPNYSTEVKTFDDACEALKEIKICMDYQGDFITQEIRVFAHPRSEKKVIYPDKNRIHRSLIIAGAEKTSLQVASSAKDTETIQFIFAQGLPELSHACLEIINEEVQRQILNYPDKSDEFAALLLRAITTSLIFANVALTEKLVNKYNEFFPEGGKELKNVLISLSYDELLAKTADYSTLTRLFEKYKLDQNPKTASVYWLLRLLTAQQADRRINDELEAWKRMDEKEVSDILSLAIEKCGKATLSRLVAAGFKFGVADIPALIQRNEKDIFVTCLNSIYRDKEPQPVLRDVFSSRVNLSADLGGVRYLDVLIFLGSNKSIKEGWGSASEISAQDLQLSLCYAYLCRNNEMVSFLHGKNVALDENVLLILLNEALEKEQFDIIEKLSDNYNLIYDEQIFVKLLGACRENMNFAPLQASFDAATDQQIIDLLLIAFKTPGCGEFVKWVVANNRELCIKYLSENIDKLDRAVLNKLAVSLGRETVLPVKDGLQQAQCLQLILADIKNNHVYLANHLKKIFPIPADELSKLLAELIVSKNQSALIYLLDTHKQLLDDKQLIRRLHENRCFRVIEKVYLEKAEEIGGNFDELLLSALQRQDETHLRLFVKNYSQKLGLNAKSILEAGIDNNFSEVVKLIFQQQLIGPEDSGRYFYRACRLQRMAMADALAEGLSLANDKGDNEETKTALDALFGRDITPEEVYTKVYCGGYSRLYSLVTRYYQPNPRSELLNAIPLQAALVRNDSKTAASILQQIGNNDPLQAALMRRDWKMTAFILQQMPSDDPAVKKVEKIIRANSEKIIKAMLVKCFAQIGKEDCREALFNMLYDGGCKNALSIITPEHRGLIQDELIRLESEMSAKGVSLERKTYGRNIILKDTSLTTVQWNVGNEAVKKAIEDYLDNRPNTLGFFSRCFDFSRGELRARHYSNLLSQCRSDLHFCAVLYALLASKDGATLKKSVATSLGYQSASEACAVLSARLKMMISPDSQIKSLEGLNVLIGNIIWKANDNNSASTDVLFKDELAALAPRV